jgi:hypothetical protein
VIHVKLLARAVHNINKKSEKKAQEFLPLFNSLISKLAKLEVKLENYPILRDPRKRQGLASNYA